MSIEGRERDVEWLQRVSRPRMVTRHEIRVRCGQSRLMSAVEAVVNVAIGMGVALGTQLVAFPLLGVVAEWGQHLALTVVFTAVSLVRSFVVRRLFERLAWRNR